MKVLSVLVIMLFVVNILSAQQDGNYYFSLTVEGTFEEVTAKTKAELKNQGFGVITEIDMDVTLKEKLDNVDMLPYKILGVCNPSFAYQTLQIEENIGVFLPCKTVIKDLGNGKVEIIMVDPSALMLMLNKDELITIAGAVSEKFQDVLNNLAIE